MIHAVHRAGTLRGRGVTCDEACGRDTAFLAQVAGLGLWDFAEVPHATPVWRQRPATAVPVWVGRGRKPTRVRVVEGALAAQTVAAVAGEVPAEPWARQTMKEGSKGPLAADCATVRVSAMREGWPGPEGWLVLRRNVQTGELKTYVSNAPADTTLSTLVPVERDAVAH